MKKTYLIDSENINEVWVEILSALHDGDEILVFYTDKSAHMSYDKIIRLIEQEVGTVRWIKCFGGQNALDFQLVTELGYCLNQAADREYIIVSNDMGYDAAVRYWKLRGCKVSRIRGSECEKLVRRQQKEDAAADRHLAAEPEEAEPERIDMSGVPVRTVPMPSIAAEGPVRPGVAAEEPRPARASVAAEGPGPMRPVVAAEEPRPARASAAAEGSGPMRPNIAAGEPSPVRTSAVTENPRPVRPVVAAEESRSMKPNAASALPIEGTVSEPVTLGTEAVGAARAADSEVQAADPEALASSGPAVRRRRPVRRRLSEMLDKPEPTVPAAPPKPERKPAADGEIRSTDVGRLQQEARRAREIVLEEEPYRVVLHTYETEIEPWMHQQAAKPQPVKPQQTAEFQPTAQAQPPESRSAAQPQQVQTPQAAAQPHTPESRITAQQQQTAEFQSTAQPHTPEPRITAQQQQAAEFRPTAQAQPPESQPAVQPQQEQASRSAAQQVQIPESQPAAQQQQEQASQPAAQPQQAHTQESQPAADDWAGRLKQVFHTCGSRDPETDLAFLTSLCKTIRMSNMSVMHNVLEYQFGQKTGNEIYRFLKENPGCRSFLSAGYSNSKKQREREYLQLVLSRNEMNPADTDGILRIINALPRKNLNAIHVALVKRFGQEKGGAVYAVIRSHVKIIRGL